MKSSLAHQLIEKIETPKNNAEMSYKNQRLHREIWFNQTNMSVNFSTVEELHTYELLKILCKVIWSEFITWIL